MRNLIFSGLHYGKHITIKQISKPTAKKLFIAGETIYITSSNMHPFGMWQQCIDITLDNELLQRDIEHFNWCKDGNYSLPIEPSKEQQFKNICTDYGYYNLDSERGKYITFCQQIK